MAVQEAKEGSATFSIEVYQRKDGWWSFRIDGRESHYRSSNEDGLRRTISTLLNGRKPGTVTLKTNGTAGKDPKDEWASLPTLADRVQAFLNRGRLADGKIPETQGTVD